MDSISNTFFSMQQKIRRLTMRHHFANILLEDTIKGLMECWIINIDNVVSEYDVFQHFNWRMSSSMNMIKDVRIEGNVYGMAEKEANDSTTEDFAIWHDSTYNFLSALQKMREIPKKNVQELIEKAFGAYIRFLHGESFRHEVEAWEESTGLIFREHYDEGIRSLSSTTGLVVDINENIGQQIAAWEEKREHEPLPPSIIEQFNLFVHSYYNCEYDETPVTILISKMVSSKEETFEQYFELLDKFIKQKAKLFR